MPTPPRSLRLSRFYSRIASNGWRDSNYFTFSVRSPALRRWIAAQLPARKKRILSIGCGSGELESHLSALGHDVVGLDMSRPMLRRGRERGLRLLVQADSQSLPFAEASFDVVMFVECIGYLPLATVFDEAWRVLRRRGRLLVTTYTDAVKVHKAYAKPGAEEIAAALAAAGFRVTARRYLNARRSAVEQAPSAAQASLIYLSSTKPPAA